jgi:hypothetical protein
VRSTKPGFFLRLPHLLKISTHLLTYRTLHGLVQLSGRHNHLPAHALALCYSLLSLACRTRPPAPLPPCFRSPTCRAPTHAAGCTGPPLLTHLGSVPGRAKGTHERMPCWWSSRPEARITSPDLTYHMLQMYVSCVLEVSEICCRVSYECCKSCKCFKDMLQVFQRHVASVCLKFFICFRRMLQAFLSGCCTCFTPML